MKERTVVDALWKYPCVVIWGLRSPTVSTQRYVHNHMHQTLVKIGVQVYWCDDVKTNNKEIPNGSLIYSTNQCCHNLEYNKNNWYVMFNTAEDVECCKNFLKLRVYGCMPMEEDCVSFDETTLFHRKHHMLYQAYGTDLLPMEFQYPVFNTNAVVNWVGSIWNDKNNHGNIATIAELQKALQKRKIEFCHYSQISDEENMKRVRESRLAPAIGGPFQTTSMMPCRIWKNISYGQFCVTNLEKSKDIFGSNVLCSQNIDELIESALSIGKDEYIGRTLDQQIIVMRDHTYLNWFYNIARAFEELGER